MASAVPSVLGLTFYEQQWRAVSAPLGPVLVLAGPGAGKTRCLTGRIGYLLQHHQATAARLCAITFTNKAAGEIQQRLKLTLGNASEAIMLGTIHALCLKILREQSRRVGLHSNFGVANEEQQKVILTRFGVHTRRHTNLLLAFGKKRLQGSNLPPADEELYRRYVTELRANKLIDYDDILYLTRLLLEESQPLLAHYQQQWDHLLVDEFQDLDTTQYTILKLLASGHRSFFAVGDDDQSIFSWRGADPRVIGRFVKDFGIAEPIILDINCRCSRTIFEAAQRILPPSELLFDKQISAVRESPHAILAQGCRDEKEELAWVVADLQEEIQRAGLRRGDFAILYRTHQLGQSFERELIKAGIGCQLAKGQALNDDPLIGRVLAALRVIAQPDSELNLEMLARKVFSDAVLTEVRRRPEFDLLSRFRGFADENTSAEAKDCWRFLYQVENLKSLGRSHASLSNLIAAIIAEGIGPYESALDACHEQLLDPENLLLAHHIGQHLRDVSQRRRALWITPLNGLEIPVRVMIQRVFPALVIHRYEGEAKPEREDLLLALSPVPAPPGVRMMVIPAYPQQMRMVLLFKALQLVESRQFRKSFADYVVFDTETTGKDVNECDIVELAAVKVRQGKIVETFHTLLRPSVPISPGASAIHGYFDKDLIGQPTLAQIWPSFRAFVGDLVLIAHNGQRFDIPLIERLTASWNGTHGFAYFDTLPLARQLYPTGSLSLANLAVRFNIDTGRGHHALDDSRCLVQVFEKLQDERLRRARKTCLANLLDCLALGLALEGRRPTTDEERALLKAASWRELRRQSGVVDEYVEEVEKRELMYPSIDELLARMGGMGLWKGGKPPDEPKDRYPESFDRLSKLVNGLKATTLEDAIRELLDRVALSTSDGAGIDPDRVSLLTFHATKGLEFARLYIIGVEDNQMPGWHALNNNNPEEMTEARRLLYVAMTRARDKLTMTYCKERGGKDSGGTMFLDEIRRERPGRELELDFREIATLVVTVTQ